MKPLRLSLKPGLLAAIGAVSLTACAGGITVSRENVAQSYLPEELYVVATGANELRTVIIGKPFDMPKDAFETAVLTSMDGKNFGPRLNLSTAPANEDARKRNVVVAFNLANIQQADALCSDTAETAEFADSGGSLTVTGVYCAGGHYLTQATARSDSVGGPDTENFRQLMTQLAIALFPDENPHRRLDESPRPTP